jgi:hypothetical protein
MDTLTNHGDLLIKANLMFAKVSKKQPVYQSRFSNHVVKNIFEKFEYYFLNSIKVAFLLDNMIN